MVKVGKKLTAYSHTKNNHLKMQRDIGKKPRNKQKENIEKFSNNPKKPGKGEQKNQKRQRGDKWITNNKIVNKIT